MASINTLFRKGYLLAGVMMAANMFAVNEMKAMETTTNNAGIPGSQESGQGAEAQSTQQNNFEIKDFSQQDKNITQVDIKNFDPKKQSPLDKLLSWENYFNFFGTLALSGANNYFKWWDYNAGSYCNLRIGCLGWRTKKFFDIVQLDFNLNLGRGAIWLIPHIINLMQNLKQKKGTEENNEVINEENAIKSGSNAGPLVEFLFKGILQGFVSIPLTFHIYNFSISISLDSMLWEFVIDKKFFKDKNNEKEGEIKDITSNL